MSIASNIEVGDEEMAAALAEFRGSQRTLPRRYESYQLRDLPPDVRRDYEATLDRRRAAHDLIVLGLVERRGRWRSLYLDSDGAGFVNADAIPDTDRKGEKYKRGTLARLEASHRRRFGTDLRR